MFKRLVKSSKKNIFYPIKNEEYRIFFEKNYLNDWVKTECLCEGENNGEILLSNFDRHNVSFKTVICTNCGLMRAKNYLNNDALSNFYKYHYRQLTTALPPKKKFEQQYQTSKRKGRYALIEKYIDLNNKVIFDIGGASGGFLHPYIKNNSCFVFDYDEQYINYAKQKDITVVKGGFDEALKQEKKPDLIILSHVIEHWNDFQTEIQKLYRLASNQTIIYIETPGIDSLKKGRRNSDILGDIQIAHKYYFASYVLENILNRYNFKCLFIDSEIRAVLIKNRTQKYTLKNNYLKIKIDLYLAEIRRYLTIKKKLLK